MLAAWQFIQDHYWMPFYLLANVAGVIMIPLGMPGLWVQFAAALVVTLGTGHLGWVWTVAVLILALSGTVLDRVMFRFGMKSARGSSMASWGAVILGFIFFFFGALIPIPIPFIGSLIGAVLMSFIGTFTGATIGEIIHQRKLSPALRVASAAVAGRACGVALKAWIAFLALCAASVGVLWDVLPKFW